MAGRPKGSVPSLIHHKPSGRARVRINGRDHWLGKWGSSEAGLAYDRLIAEYLATRRIRDPGEVSEMTPVATVVTLSPGASGAMVAGPDALVEGDGQLSGPVLERSRMVKLMKTAAALRERTAGSAVGRIVEMLVEQILEIMPELADVTPWHTVGQRRTLEELGRTGRCPVSEDLFRRS